MYVHTQINICICIIYIYIYIGKIPEGVEPDIIRVEKQLDFEEASRSWTSMCTLTVVSLRDCTRIMLATILNPLLSTHVFPSPPR